MIRLAADELFRAMKINFHFTFLCARNAPKREKDETRGGRDSEAKTFSPRCDNVVQNEWKRAQKIE
jgi:hypothetical protein